MAVVVIVLCWTVWGCGRGIMDALVQKLKVALDKITAARARLIASAKNPSWARPRFVTHLVGPLIAVIVIASTFAHTQRLNLFSLHPTCMALAFMVLMPEGVVAYKNHLLLDSFGPIMSNGAKAKNRTIHMTLQVLASLFAALGLLFIAANKLYQGKNILPHTMHSVLGTIALLAMVMQVMVGRLKQAGFSTGGADGRIRGKRNYRWHGKMGLLLYDLATLAFVLGVFAFFGLSLTAVAVPILVAYAWLNVHLQMHETKHLTVPVYTEPADAPSGEPVPEAQPLAEEGAQESKGDRTYPV